jgi:hypothetical protein
VHRANSPSWVGSMESVMPELYNTKFKDSKEVLTYFETKVEKKLVT